DVRTREGLLCFRNLGVDVDLVPSAQKPLVSPEEIDRRKEWYLLNVLRRFPLRAHWLIETQHGFHLVFRIQPRRDTAGIRLGQEVNAGLVRALRGDENAVLLTQLLRVPGYYQFKTPEHPFLCRLLLDRSGTIPPYELEN